MFSLLFDKKIYKIPNSIQMQKMPKHSIVVNETICEEECNMPSVLNVT